MLLDDFFMKMLVSSRKVTLVLARNGFLSGSWSLHLLVGSLPDAHRLVTAGIVRNRPKSLTVHFPEAPLFGVFMAVFRWDVPEDLLVVETGLFHGHIWWNLRLKVTGLCDTAIPGDYSLKVYRRIFLWAIVLFQPSFGYTFMRWTITGHFLMWIPVCLWNAVIPCETVYRSSHECIAENRSEPSRNDPKLQSMSSRFLG